MHPILFPIKRGDFARATPSAFEIAERFCNRVERTDGCWNWLGQRQSKGYGWLQFAAKRLKGQKCNPKIRIRAHRISWLLHFGEIPEGLGVLHTCDNRRCVRPDHLFLGTDKDNWEDAKAKGRRTKIRGRFAKGPNCK